MKNRTLFAGSAALLLVGALIYCTRSVSRSQPIPPPAPAATGASTGNGAAQSVALTSKAGDPIKLYAHSGSKVRIEGTSDVHDWQTETRLIGGSMEAGPDFPLEPGQAVTPGKVQASADTFVMVTGFKSIEKDGRPYSDSMDDRMCEALKSKEFPRITFHLTDFTIKEAAKDKNSPYLCEASGELGVAGVTNKITMPISILPLGDQKLKISGVAPLKMTDFKISPPTKFGVFRTADDVKVIFDWMVAPRNHPATSASR